MRENETRIGGLQWGMFSIFEPSAPHPHRTIDQSIVAWRLASRATGTAAFENPRSVIQRTVSMVTGGSNREHHARLQDSIQPLRPRRETREANIRSGFRYPSPEEVSEIQRRFHNPELQHAMEAARQEIMRRYWPRNVTLEPQEYFERMTQMISEPAPPGYREAIQAAQNAD